MAETLYLGLDVGNTFTKCDGIKFESKVVYGYDKFNEALKTKVVYKNVTYSVGVGSEITGRNRYFSPIYKILLLTGIAKSFPDVSDINCNIVMGLPINHFKDDNLNADVKKMLDSIKNEVIEVDDKIYKITINKSSLWIEGGIILLDNKIYANKKIIVVDIGGYTIDTIEFIYNKAGLNKTLAVKGMLLIKEEILNMFNIDNKTNITNSEEIFNAVINNKTFYVNGKKAELSKYRNIVELYIAKIFNAINIAYDFEDKEIIFIGGGSIALSKLLCEYESDYNLEIINDEYINQKTFKSIAKTITVLEK